MLLQAMMGSLGAGGSAGTVILDPSRSEQKGLAFAIAQAGSFPPCLSLLPLVSIL